jgi:hypothetical protein
MIVACAAVAIAASGAVPASAASYPYEAAFMANSGSLWLWTTAGGANMSLGMAADTSPSIAQLATGGYQFAFQANTGDLWIVGAAGNVNTGHQMMQGTSPVISALKGSGYVVAWADPDGDVWTYTPSSGYTETSYNLGTEYLSGDMSVAVAGLATGGYEVALIILAPVMRSSTSDPRDPARSLSQAGASSPPVRCQSPAWRAEVSPWPGPPLMVATIPPTPTM